MFSYCFLRYINKYLENNYQVQDCNQYTKEQDILPRVKIRILKILERLPVY